MGYEELIKAVEEEGRREYERILSEAEERAKAIVDEARRNALKQEQTLIEQTAAQIRRLKSEAINSARTEARRRVLERRRELVEGLFKEAIERIKRLPRDRYGEIIRGFFKELEQDWQQWGGADPPVVYVSAGDAELFKDCGYRVVASAELSGGVVFSSTDGRYRVENTLESRLNRLMPELMVELTSIISWQPLEGFRG